MKSLTIISLLLCLLLTDCSFQTSLFKELNNGLINKNLILSPLSAYQILGLTANGAKGQTLKEMLLALGNSDLNEVNAINKQIINTVQSFSTVEMANAVMTVRRPKTDFLNVAATYRASVEGLRSLAQVNNWCNLQTHGKIPTILDSLPANTEMVLLNALDFKGAWYTKFDPEKTYRTTFNNYGNYNKPKKISEMTITDDFNFYYDDDIQMVEMPFLKDSMSALIIYPSEKLKINDYIASLTDDKLNSYIKKLKKTTVQVDLPKFELAFNGSLIKPLNYLGMKVPFTADADFTGLMDNKDLKIEVVQQKSDLRVEEEGVIASSATAVVITTKGGFNPYQMIITRPFLFFLRNSELPQNYQMVMMAKIEEL